VKAYKMDGEGLFWLSDGAGRDLVKAGSRGEFELRLAAMGARMSGGWRPFAYYNNSDKPVCWQADVEEERE